MALHHDGQAARDPVWQAKVISEVARNPGLKEVIEQKCTGCHMPMAKAQALVDGTPVEALAPGFYDAGHPLHAPAIDGVSCTLCHQVRPDNFGAPASFSGGYALDLSTEAPGRPIFGPFEAPEVATMQASTGFTPTHGPHMEAAEHCATCHDLYTPYVDAEGNVLGEFPEQTPYAEWKESRFAQDGTPCQGCHMPLAEGAVSIASVPAGLAPRQPFYQHFFVGGNAFMLQVLRDWAGDLGATADAAHFDATLARVTEQIETRSAILTLESAALQGDTLQASLHVAPLTGHKFPASFPSRRAWLHVTVKDFRRRRRVRVRAAGRRRDDRRQRRRLPTAAAFEPHYDLITRPTRCRFTSRSWATTRAT